MHLYSPDCALVFLKKHKTIAIRSDFDLRVCSGSHKCIFILCMACCLFHAGITCSLMLDRNKQTVPQLGLLKQEFYFGVDPRGGAEHMKQLTMNAMSKYGAQDLC